MDIQVSHSIAHLLFHIMAGMADLAVLYIQVGHKDFYQEDLWVGNIEMVRILYPRKDLSQGNLWVGNIDHL